MLEVVRNGMAASWQHVMPLLAPHVHVVACDPLGLGAIAPSANSVILSRPSSDLASVITSDHQHGDRLQRPGQA